MQKFYLRLISIPFAFVVMQLLAPISAFADSSEILTESIAKQGRTAQRPLPPPLPPGATSEDGDMKVWDTRGPVEVSPHIPNTTDSSEFALPNVIVDTRRRRAEANKIYPGEDDTETGDAK